MSEKQLQIRARMLDETRNMILEAQHCLNQSKRALAHSIELADSQGCPQRKLKQREALTPKVVDNFVSLKHALPEVSTPSQKSASLRQPHSKSSFLLEKEHETKVLIQRAKLEALEAESKRIELLAEQQLRQEEEQKRREEEENDRLLEVQFETELQEKNQLDEEQNRVESEKLEQERCEQEKLENDRIQQEKLERDRLERENLEREQLEQERLAQDQLEEDRLEQKKLELERLEREKLELERLEEERLEQDKLQREKLEEERLEQEKLELERLEQEKLEQERLEEERLKQEKLELERLEQEKLEQERLKEERLEQERLQQEKWEEERLEQEKFEQEKRELEKLEQEKVEQSRKEQEKQEHDRLEQKRMEKERAEQDRIMEKERLEEEEMRLEKETLERNRLEEENRELKRLLEFQLDENAKIEEAILLVDSTTQDEMSPKHVSVSKQDSQESVLSKREESSPRSHISFEEEKSVLHALPPRASSLEKAFVVLQDEMLMPPKKNLFGLASNKTVILVLREDKFRYFDKKGKQISSFLLDENVEVVLSPYPKSPSACALRFTPLNASSSSPNESSSLIFFPDSFETGQKWIKSIEHNLALRFELPDLGPEDPPTYYNYLNVKPEEAESSHILLQAYADQSRSAQDPWMRAKLNEALQVLNDPFKRVEYDNFVTVQRRLRFGGKATVKVRTDRGEETDAIPSLVFTDAQFSHLYWQDVSLGSTLTGRHLCVELGRVTEVLSASNHGISLVLNNSEVIIFTFETKRECEDFGAAVRFTKAPQLENLKRRQSVVEQSV